MINGGALYAAIDVTKLCELRSSLGRPRLEKIDSMPELFAQYKFWKFGDGSNSSKERLILASMYTKCRSDVGHPIDVSHFVIAGPSKLLIGRIVTQFYS